LARVIISRAVCHDRGDRPGRGGGGGASPGGIVPIYAKRLILYSNAIIHADGGNGGNGANAAATSNVAAGSGGAAADGGILILVYNELQNNGTLRTAAGTVGTGGITSGGSVCNNGTSGATATAGTVFQFEVSL